MVSAIYRYNLNGQEAVKKLLEHRNAISYLIAFDNTNGTATGPAISASSSQPVTIPVIIRDDSKSSWHRNDSPSPRTASIGIYFLRDRQHSRHA